MTDTHHLTAGEFVDLVEGATSEGDWPHLAACASCRRQLADLREMQEAASRIDVPEPSPLFWNHFSSRVREAVADEPVAGAGWRRRFWSWPGMLAPLSAVAAAVLVVAGVFNARGPVPHAGATKQTSGSSAASTLELLSDSGVDDDASWKFVADLTDSLDWDAAADASFAPDGSAEHAVTHLSLSELQQLQRLLQEELSGKGA